MARGKHLKSNSRKIPKKSARVIDKSKQSTPPRIPPRATKNIVDLTFSDAVHECAEALEGSIVDGKHREAHYALIAQLVASSPADIRLVSLLKAAEKRMRELSRQEPIQILTQDRSEDFALAAELRATSSRASLYVYHGTIFGRLESIEECGLVPAMNPVWKNRPHVERHCQEAVFFTTAWRHAVQWAETAHRHSRGRRDAIIRRPVVIRLPEEGLAIEPDRLAVAPGCVLVRGKVSAHQADVFVGPLLGIPQWLPLKVAIADRTS